MTLKNTTYAMVFAGSLLNGADQIKNHTVDVEIVVLAKDLNDRNEELKKEPNYAIYYDFFSHHAHDGPKLRHHNEDVYEDTAPAPEPSRLIKFSLTFDNEPTMNNVTKKLESITHSKAVACGINIEYPSSNVSIHANLTPRYGRRLPRINGEVLSMEKLIAIENSKIKVSEYIDLHSKIWSEDTSGSTTTLPKNKRLSYYSTQIPGGIYRKIKNRELTGKFSGKRF